MSYNIENCFKIKDSQICHIRLCEERDAEDWYDGIKGITKEGKYLLVEPDDVYSVDKIKEKINKSVDIKNQAIIVAEVDNRVVGHLLVTRGNAFKLKHTAEFGLWIIPKFRNIGIGGKLIESCEFWAKENGIKKLNLSVFSTNEGAIHLYKKSGFLIEGIRRNQVFLYDQYCDEVLMSKKI